MGENTPICKIITVNANIEKRQLFFAIHPELCKNKIVEIKNLDINYQRIIRGHISVFSALKILVKSIANLK